MTDIERAVQLMKLAAEYLKDSPSNDALIFYDDVECDGECLAEDLLGAAEALEPSA